MENERGGRQEVGASREDEHGGGREAGSSRSCGALRSRLGTKGCGAVIIGVFSVCIIVTTTTLVSMYMTLGTPGFVLEDASVMKVDMPDNNGFSIRLKVVISSSNSGSTKFEYHNLEAYAIYDGLRITGSSPFPMCGPGKVQVIMSSRGVLPRQVDRLVAARFLKDFKGRGASVDVVVHGMVNRRKIGMIGNKVVIVVNCPDTLKFKGQVHKGSHNSTVNCQVVL